MYTYVNDPPCTTSTAEGIQATGEVALSRALYIDRVIAFTASGSTMEYGRPSWAELINKVIRLAVKAYIEREDKGSKKQKAAWKEFISFFDLSSFNQVFIGLNNKTVKENFKALHDLITSFNKPSDGESKYEKCSTLIDTITKEIVKTYKEKYSAKLFKTKIKKRLDKFLEFIEAHDKDIFKNMINNLSNNEEFKKQLVIFCELINSFSEIPEKQVKWIIAVNKLLDTCINTYTKLKKEKEKGKGEREREKYNHAPGWKAFKLQLNNDYLNIYSYYKIDKTLRLDNEFTTSFLGLCEEFIIWDKNNDPNNSKQQYLKARKEVSAELCKSKNEKIHIDIIYKANLNLKAPQKDSKAFTTETNTYFNRNDPDASGVKRVNGGIEILWRSIELEHHKVWELKNIKPIFEQMKIVEGKSLDPLLRLYEKLKIKRYLTLNYDIEIERMLARHFANKGDYCHQDFCEFLDNPVGIKPTIQRRELRNGMQQSILTSTIANNNLGDLFTFGAFPTNFQTSVFHLHGRVDDPENMVITHKDYEQLYLQSSEKRKSFEEARHTVFTGSDILFIGVGMTETDVMTPLRDFVAQHRDIVNMRSRVYALLFSGTDEKNYKALNAGLSHKLFKHYGVYTLFIDGEDNDEDKNYRYARKALDDASEVLRNNVPSSQGFPKKLKKKLKEAQELLNKINDNEKPPKQEAHLAEMAINHIIDPQNTVKTDTIGLIAKLCDALSNRVKSQALQKKIKQLSQNKDDWWRESQTRAEPRFAIYGSKAGEKRATGEPLVWIRQRTAFEYLANNIEDAFEDKQMKQLLELGGNKNKQRIIRLVGKSGCGKGSLINMLSTKFKVKEEEKGKEGEKSRQEYYPFELIFDNKAEDSEKKELTLPLKPKHYAGGFFVRLTFTLEFTSVIFGLVRFLVRILDIKDDDNDPESEMFNNIGAHSLDQYFGLTLLIKALNILEEKEKKIFICLSGLDRLVNPTGDAFSPVHREFFRIITGFDPKKEVSAPIDLVLISKKQAFPIRFLSSEETDRTKIEAAYVYRKDIKTWIKPWEKLVITDFTNTFIAANKNAQQAITTFFDNNKHSAPDFPKKADTEYSEDLKGLKDTYPYLYDFTSKHILHTYLLANLIQWQTHILDAKNEQQMMLERLDRIVGQKGGHELVRQMMHEFRAISLKLTPYSDQNTALGTDHCIDVPDNIIRVIMRHLCLFSYPIQACVLLACPDLAKYLRKENLPENYNGVTKKKLLKRALDQLVAQSLIIKILPVGQEDIKDKDKGKLCWKDYRYILHQDIASVIGEDMNFISEYSPSTAPYRTTLYCGQPVSYGIPTKERFDFISRLLDHSLEKVSEKWKCKRNVDYSNKKFKTEKKHKKSFKQSSSIVRGMYAMLRGSFSMGSISRMDSTIELDKQQPYEVYRCWIRLIINTAVRLSEHRKRFKLSGGADITPTLPFYLEETAWLYNERGLVSFVQGRLFDAIQLYHQAMHVLSARDDGTATQAYFAPKRRIEVNLALALIERGEIHKAIKRLNNIIDGIVLNKHSTRSYTKTYARGYLGLCEHLTGNFVKAEKEYKFVIKEAAALKELRAVSIFQRHLADLMRTQERTEEAKRLLVLSEKAAAQAQQEDILHYTLIAQARLMRDLKERSKALLILRRSEDYANTMGLQKMLAETLKVRGEVMLAEGEVTQAGRVTAQAVAISKRNGMRLRKISAAILQAKVYEKRGQNKFAKQILDEVTREANVLGYSLKLGDAQKLRQSL